MRFLENNLKTARTTLQQVRLNLWSNGFTMIVIGIALALPVILAVILSNMQQVTQGWDIGNQITVFLKGTTSDNEGKKLADQIRTRSGVERVDFLSKQAALEEFSSRSGFADALELLPNNPLPAVIIIHPRSGALSDKALVQWADELQKMPTVDLVQLDKEWLQRLGALIQLIDRGIWILAALLIVAVALIIGNTIRLLIQSRREEIVLINIIGATNSFVRRPFLFTGIWFGLGGGIISCFLVSLGMFSLQQPVMQLAGLYSSQFILSGMSFLQILSVLFFSSLAGYISAYVVVTHYLRKMV